MRISFSIRVNMCTQKSVTYFLWRYF